MFNLSIIGLGKLGLCTAVCFASKGFKVIGVDINQNFVDLINKGKAPFYEANLQQLLTKTKKNLKATTNYLEAIIKTNITFLILPTPNNKDNNFSDKYLKEALKQLAQIFKTKKKYHLFVITSTVSPQTTEKNLIPLIEKISNKKLNKHFGVCYNPEFIALGSVLKNFLNPDLVLIGESNKYAGDILEKIYQQTCENNPYIARMSIVSAEITKISLNSFVTMKISFANTLANICEKIPQANIDDITTALGTDKRISPYYLKGGLSYGGPCFPRDNKAFCFFAKKFNVDAKLAKATDEINNYQLKNLVDLVLKHIPKNKNNFVSILGLAYKPNTPVIEESPAIKLIEELLKKNLKIIVYDPLAIENAKNYFADKITYANSLKNCFLNSSVCIITTPDKEFLKINENYIKHNPTTIIDCWRIIDKIKLSKNIKYISLGKFATNKF